MHQSIYATPIYYFLLINEKLLNDLFQLINFLPKLIP